jgi:hypothetical protein
VERRQRHRFTGDFRTRHVGGDPPSRGHNIGQREYASSISSPGWKSVPILTHAVTVAPPSHAIEGDLTQVSRWMLRAVDARRLRGQPDPLPRAHPVGTLDAPASAILHANLTGPPDTPPAADGIVSLSQL